MLLYQSGFLPELLAKIKNKSESRKDFNRNLRKREFRKNLYLSTPIEIKPQCTERLRVGICLITYTLHIPYFTSHIRGI